MEESEKPIEGNEKAELDEKLRQMGVEGIKKYALFVLFLIIVVSLVFLTYIATAAIIFSFIPTIIISIVNCTPNLFMEQITGDTSAAVGKNFLSLGILIVFFPIFTLFLWVIWTAFFSFFNNMWKNLNIKYLFSGVITNLEQGSSYKGVLIQYLLFAALFLFLDLIFFDKDLGFITIIYGAAVLVTGFWRLVVHSWKSMFSKEDSNNEHLEELNPGENDTYKLEDCCCCKCSCCKKCIGKLGNSVAIPMNLLDPAELRFMSEFHAFIDDPNMNPYIHLKWNLRMIPGIIVFVYCIYLFIIGISSCWTNDALFNSETFLFPFAVVAFLPLLVIFNISTMFLPKKNYDDKGILRTCMIIIGILYIVGIVLIFSAAIAEAAYKPSTAPVIKYYEPNKTTQGYYTKNPLPFCSMNIHGLDAIQAAGLLLLPKQTYTLNQSQLNQSINEIATYMQYNSLVYFYGNKHEFNFMYAINEGSLFYIFGGNDLVLHWLLCLESIVYQYLNMIVGFVVPFFNIVYNLSKYPFLISANIIQSMLFQIPIVDQFANNVYLSVQSFMQFNLTQVSLIGQGIGATIAKRIASKQDIINFDGLVFDGFTPENSFYVGSSYVPSKYLYNIVTSAILGSEEKEWVQNHKINGKKLFPNVGDAFCMTAAMCARDNRYVSLCEQLGVSKEQYYEMIPNPVNQK